jgi:hypothetical protein
MNKDHIATPEEEEAFNMVEQQSNLGKQILRDMKLHEPVAYIGTDGKLGWLQKPKVLYSAPIALFTHPTVKESLTTQQEPVAWIVWNNWRKEAAFFTKEGADDFRDASQRTHDLSGNLAAFRTEPLYTHPSDAFEQGIQEGMKRERALWELAKTSQEIEQPRPLTDEQIDDIWLEVNLIRAPDKRRQAFARAIEAAHGIKE